MGKAVVIKLYATVSGDFAIRFHSKDETDLMNTGIFYHKREPAIGTTIPEERANRIFLL